MSGDVPAPDDDNMDWLVTEMNLTAERAKEKGLTPLEFLLGLRNYARTFARKHAIIDSAPDN